MADESPEVTEDTEPESSVDDLLPTEDRTTFLIHQVDPEWQPGETTQHLEFKTASDGSLLRVELAMSPAAVRQLRKRTF